MKTQLPLLTARRLADKVAATIDPVCDRIVIAGSIRRCEDIVGDIEIVVIPRRAAGMFPGQPGESLLDPVLDRLVREGRLASIKSGDRFKQFAFPKLAHLGPPQLDLFLVTPETWGVQLALRTGPADFSRALVTEQIRGGRLLDGHAVHDGRVWPPGTYMRGMMDAADYRGPFFQPLGQPLATLEERDFLELAGGWLDPGERRIDAPLMTPPPLNDKGTSAAPRCDVVPPRPASGLPGR